MLIINRKFTLGINASHLKELENKLKEFQISTIKYHYYETIILNKKVEKIYIDCLENDEKIEKLINYLKMEFEGYASITF